MTATISPVPAHVPPSLVRDFDMYNVPGAEADPHVAWKKLQEGPRIFWTPRNGGHWVITRGEEILESLRDPARFSSLGGTIPRNLSIGKPMPPVIMDPPEHNKYRLLLMPFFSPRAVAELEKEIRQLFSALIEKYYAEGACEFVWDIAKPLPATVFLRTAGLPQDDMNDLLHWVEANFHGSTDEERVGGFQKISAYVLDIIQKKLANPGDDIYSKIIWSELDGKPLSDDDRFSILLFLLQGAMDSTASLATFLMHHLATHNDDRRYMCSALKESPEKFERGLEELMRRYPIANLVRTAKGNFNYKGIEFRDGDPVLAASFLYNLDEEKFNDPMKVDFDRKIEFSGTFGFGPHRCMGLHLARLEIKVFLQEWLSRIPDFRLNSMEKPRGLSGQVVALTSLPLQWSIK